MFDSPSTSMAPTIPHRQPARRLAAFLRVLAAFLRLVRSPVTGRWPDHRPARGDIVVFRTPKDLRTFYIKRLIGLPGDRVQIVKGRLTINGADVAREPAKKNLHHPLDRKLDVPTYVETLPEGVSYQIIETEGDTGGFDNTEEFHVPAGHYFFLGDNRDNSTDSRVPHHDRLCSL